MVKALDCKSNGLYYVGSNPTPLKSLVYLYYAYLVEIGRHNTFCINASSSLVVSKLDVV